MKVAVVHDWLVVEGGAEQVLKEILKLFPNADVFSTVFFLPEDQRGFLNGKVPTTTFVQRLPFAAKRYRHYLPLLPIAIEQLDLSSYDLVISSSYAVAKGVITGPNQVHVSYVHSPMRYAWDLQHAYLRETGLDRGFLGAIARIVLHYARIWDTRTANGVDFFAANSEFISRRIRKAYGRDAEVIYPPVDVERFTLSRDREDFYLTASRLVPYKRIPLIAEAFAAMPDKKLVVIGDGPEMAALKKHAAPNIHILGYQSNEVVVKFMQRAKAFVFAAEEDFGIVPVEAQACGTPVIAYGRGGALETVRGEGPDRTGVFFNTQSVASIVDAVGRFEAVAKEIRPETCRVNALRFSASVFREAFQAFVAAAIESQLHRPPRVDPTPLRHRQGEGRPFGLVSHL